MLVQPSFPKAVNLHDEEGNIIDRSSSNMQYLLLIVDKQTKERTFEIVSGRQEVYNHIKEQLLETTDINESYILSEKSTILTAITIKEFMKNMAEHFNDDFDIDAYEEDKVFDPEQNEENNQEEREDQLHLLHPVEAEDI